MAYTETDLTNVQAAITALIQGRRVVSVSIGDKSVNYGTAQLQELRQLRQEIQEELKAADDNSETRVRYLRMQTGKGLS